MWAGEWRALLRLPKLSRTRIVLGVTAVIVGYFLVAGATTALHSRSLNERENHLRAEIQEIEQRYQRLGALQEYLDSQEYIEAVAREQLGLVREGESSIVVIPSEREEGPPAGEPDEDAGHLWWETLIR
jgi:cell division protein DivIC